MSTLFGYEVVEQAQEIDRLSTEIASLTGEVERLRALLGRWKTAREAVHEALQTAQELNHGFRAALQPKEGNP